MQTEQHRAAAARARGAHRPLNDHWQVLDQLQEERLNTRQTRAAAARSSVPTLPAWAFARAATVWMGLTFALCYVMLPATWEALGIRAAQLWTLPGDLLALFGLWGAAMVLTASRHVQNDGITVDLDSLAASDKLPAAALGGLLTWGFLHNVLPGLVPFHDMPGAYLGAFVAANVLENALFGVIAASLARTRRGAFTLGVASQLILLSLAWLV